jgi:glycosyltransferase involved in cell wall biosynthesis
MGTLSVCIATFNGEKFIERQLISILSQLGENDDVIISDDSSTDNTLSVIRSFADRRIKLFPGQDFACSARNFNHAISRSSGDHIFLSDQDDIWEEDKIEVVLKYLGNYDLVVSDCTVIDGSGKVLLPSFFGYRNSRTGILKNLFKNSYLGCCMAFNKNLKERVLPIPSSLHNEHDWWIGMIAEIYYKPVFIREKLIRYVRHGANASPTGERTTYSFERKLFNRTKLVFGLLKLIIKQR